MGFISSEVKLQGPTVQSSLQGCKTFQPSQAAPWAGLSLQQRGVLTHVRENVNKPLKEMAGSVPRIIDCQDGRYFFNNDLKRSNSLDTD